MASLASNQNSLPLFETKQSRFTILRRLFASTTFVVVCFILVYRIISIRKQTGNAKWVWIGMFLSEFCMFLFWICTQALRWNVTYNFPFKDRLSHRYEEKLPRVDVFVCTADPVLEPPVMVANTVLSAMSFNYPAEKLAVYLSDDGGSEFTFYAMFEAGWFSERWIPFCKKYRIEPRSPEAYFAKYSEMVNDISCAKQDFFSIKKLYEQMKKRIERVMDDGFIPPEIRKEHKGFSEWDQEVTKKDHQAIVEIMIDGRDSSALDSDGCRLPALVYMAREKRPHYHHFFKAGALNSLIRISSKITDGSIILNLDCDMYVNDADAIRDALCFFMDERRGREFAFVQHPQGFDNVTKNNLYANSNLVISKIEIAGLGGYDTSPYCGTGCFHRREALSGMKYRQTASFNPQCKEAISKTVKELEEEAKAVASCSYEKDTQWGKEIGLVYGFPVEDIVTGLAMQCRGWKSVYYCPDKNAFLGVAPCTLELSLVQYTRWSEGMFSIFMSKYCPFISGFRRLKLASQLGYCTYLLWAATSLPTLYYLIVVPLCLLAGIPLFPQVRSLWFAAFAYICISNYTYSLLEALTCGHSLTEWWNIQRMQIFRKTTSYFFGFIDVIVKLLGLSEAAFVITAKVVNEDVRDRYEQELMEFGSSSMIFVIITTLAFLHVFALIGAMIMAAIAKNGVVLEMGAQVVICLLVGLVNLPVYEGVFWRRDNGCVPVDVGLKSAGLALVASIVTIASC